MATIRFGEEDRDKDGFIRLSPPPAVETSIEVQSARPPARAAAPARPTLSPRLRYQLTIASAVAAGLLLVLVSLRMRAARAPIASAPRPIVVPTAAMQPSATPPAVAGRLLIAFAAPDGQPLGAIESTRLITPTAHYGAAWIQADVAGSGLVWLRAADSPDLPIAGPDLAPPPTRTPAPRPPTATSEPQPPCAQFGVEGKMIELCGWGDLDAQAKQQWIATYGGNPGIVTTPTPPEWSKP